MIGDFTKDLIFIIVMAGATVALVTGVYYDHAEKMYKLELQSKGCVEMGKDER